MDQVRFIHSKTKHGHQTPALGDQYLAVLHRQKKRQKELKNFQRVTLEPGETKRVEFQMSPEDLAFTGLDEKPVIEPGEYHVSAL